jgi:hypothetical protein
MAALTLTSPGRRPLRPLVEGAIHNELRVLETGIRRTEQRLRTFEEKYDLSTETFLQRYENDELQETLDYAEWIGEYRMLQRLKEKSATLREIRFAD